jgi:hypothetical protein
MKQLLEQEAANVIKLYHLPSILLSHVHTQANSGSVIKSFRI